MENVNPDSPSLRHIVASGALADDPFVLLDIGCALDLLTPPLRGEQVSYADYVAAFDDDVELFYPDEPAASG